MANTNAAGVYRIDTTGDFPHIKSICGIKYIGAASGTAIIKDKDTSGSTVWNDDGDATVRKFEEVEMTSSNGFRVEVTNSAIVYLYTR